MVQPNIVGDRVPCCLFLSISEPLGQREDGGEGPHSFLSILLEGKSGISGGSHSCGSLSSSADMYLVDISSRFWQ